MQTVEQTRTKKDFSVRIHPLKLEPHTIPCEMRIFVGKKSPILLFFMFFTFPPLASLETIEFISDFIQRTIQVNFVFTSMVHISKQGLF